MEGSQTDPRHVTRTLRWRGTRRQPWGDQTQSACSMHGSGGIPGWGPSLRENPTESRPERNVVFAADTELVPGETRRGLGVKPSPQGNGTQYPALKRKTEKKRAVWGGGKQKQ